jgi:hypothetical protein
MRRRGVILMEVVVACGLAAVLMAVSVQMLTLMATQRRDVERRAIAQQEAANLIERVASIPFEQLTPDSLQSLTIDPEVARLLPAAKASLSLAAEPGPTPAKRVAVEVSWIGVGKRRELPVRLTSWVFAPQPAKAAEPLPSAGDAAPAVVPPSGASQPATEGPAVLPPVSDAEPPVASEGGSP